MSTEACVLASLFGRATFVMDRGYDDNKMFLKLNELRQNYVKKLLKEEFHSFENCLQAVPEESILKT